MNGKPRGAILADAILGITILTVGLLVVANGMRTVTRASVMVEERSVSDRLAASKLAEVLLSPGLFRETKGAFPKPLSRYRYRTSVEQTPGEGLLVTVTVGIRKKGKFMELASRRWAKGREF